MASEAVDWAARLSAGGPGILTTRSTGERLVGRPIEFLPVPFAGSLWFVCPRRARLLSQIRLVSEVQVSFVRADGWTALSGKAQQVVGSTLPAEVEVRLDEGDATHAAVRVSVLTGRHWPPAGRWSPDAEGSSTGLVPD